MHHSAGAGGLLHCCRRSSNIVHHGRARCGGHCGLTVTNRLVRDSKWANSNHIRHHVGPGSYIQAFSIILGCWVEQNSPARAAPESARAERTEAIIRTIVKSLRVKVGLNEGVRVQKSRN